MGKIPLLIDFTDRKVLIFGGGSVGGRKAKLFSEADANVHVFGKSFTKDLEEMSESGSIELHRGKFCLKV